MVVITLSIITPETNPIWVYAGAQVGGFLLKMLIAIQACRFFVDARRSGSLELLLCTPLRNGEILSGQWLALKRIFLWPLIVFVLLNFVPFAFKIVVSLSGAGPQDILTACLSASGGLLMVAWFLAKFVADVFAIVWFGMWLALTLKKPGLAPALTILLVMIVPLILWCGAVLADVFFILWGAIRLQQDLRWIIAQQYQRGVATGVVRAPLGPAASPPIIVR
jgi:ABC-type transport system involved in multi-copper enzyme maturation permease subunit